MQLKRKPFPFITVGGVLLVLSFAGTVILVIRAFDRIRDEDDVASAQASLSLALHPAFAVCTWVGAALVLFGILRLIRSNRRTKVAEDESAHPANYEP
jgi:hypothetical protein